MKLYVRIRDFNRIHASVRSKGAVKVDKCEMQHHGMRVGTKEV